jgi:hypothetical protein
VQTDDRAVRPVEDTTVAAGVDAGSNFGSVPALQVSTNTELADRTAVALLKFDGADIGDAGGVVSAVLSLRLQPGGVNTEPQVLTVLGVGEDWDEGSASWASLATLRAPPDAGVRSTSDNFVVWAGAAPPSVVGHVTVPPGSAVGAAGVSLMLDVTDAVKAGVRSFGVVRMMHRDASSAGPKDEIQGAHVFGSREAESADAQPQLLLSVQSSGPRSPPPIPAKSGPSSYCSPSHFIAA